MVAWALASIKKEDFFFSFLFPFLFPVCLRAAADGEVLLPQHQFLNLVDTGFVPFRYGCIPHSSNVSVHIRLVAPGRRETGHVYVTYTHVCAAPTTALLSLCTLSFGSLLCYVQRVQAGPPQICRPGAGPDRQAHREHGGGGRGVYHFCAPLLHPRGRRARGKAHPYASGRGQGEVVFFFFFFLSLFFFFFSLFFFFFFFFFFPPRTHMLSCCLPCFLYELTLCDHSLCPCDPVSCAPVPLFLPSAPRSPSNSAAPFFSATSPPETRARERNQGKGWPWGWGEQTSYSLLPFTGARYGTSMVYIHYKYGTSTAHVRCMYRTLPSLKLLLSFTTTVLFRLLESSFPPEGRGP